MARSIPERRLGQGGAATSIFYTDYLWVSRTWKEKTAICSNWRRAIETAPGASSTYVGRSLRGRVGSADQNRLGEIELRFDDYCFELSYPSAFATAGAFPPGCDFASATQPLQQTKTGLSFRGRELAESGRKWGHSEFARSARHCCLPAVDQRRLSSLPATRRVSVVRGGTARSLPAADCRRAGGGARGRVDRRRCFGKTLRCFPNLVDRAAERRYHEMATWTDRWASHSKMSSV